MLIWSQYNTLFTSERGGSFLYNAMSNCLLELDQAHFDSLRQLENNPGHAEENIGDAFSELLREKHVLVEEEENEKLLQIKQYQRNCNCYGQQDLSLTICPTLACNFSCPYCFETSRDDTTVMHDATISNLVAFMQQRAGTRKIHLDWYGGEPTLAFDVIETITRRVLEKGLRLEGAQLITNGYLLDQEKIDRLNELKIDTVQVTLDGPERIHDKRRTLKNHAPTFGAIIANIDRLMESSFNGQCLIRVNVDKTNKDHFAGLHRSLSDRYSEKNVTIYAATLKDTTPETLDVHEWAQYCLDLYWQHGITTKYMVYPKNNESGLCLAHYSNSFVAGPRGEIYKCWEDVGCSPEIVGNVNDSNPVTNHDVLARYSVAADPFLNASCVACRFLPICTEACPKKRVQNQSIPTTEKANNICTHFKDYLIGYMEIAYDIFTTSQQCRALLSKPTRPLSQKGFRVIFPARETSID